MSEAVEREVVLRAPVRRVWAALTRPASLSEWFGAQVEIDLRPGGRASFGWPDGTRRSASIEALEEPRLVVLRWLPFEQEPGGRIRPRPPGTVRLVLTPRGGHTVLRVSEVVDEDGDFESHPPVFTTSVGEARGLPSMSGVAL